MSILLETHHWSGVSFGSAGGWTFAVLGWITIGVSRNSILNRMRLLVSAMKSLAER